jgi:type I restriction enzyme, S subunit
MDVKTGYKKTEVGVIPEDWVVTPLTGLATILHGFAFQSQHFKPMGKYWLTTPGHFHETGGFRDVGEKQKFYDGPLPEGCLLSEGDLIVAMTEQTDGLLGSAALVPTGGIYLHNQRLGKVNVLSPEVSIRFLYRTFNFESYRDRVRETAAGTKVKHTSPSKLLEIPIALPPTKVEQEAIAETLGDADDFIDSLEQHTAKKRQIKQGAVQELLTGKTRLPGFEGEWRTVRFGDVALPRQERVDPRKTGTLAFCVELEHIESGTGQLKGSTQAGAGSSLKSTFRVGDVLFGKLRAYLRKYWLADREGVCSTEIWVLEANRHLAIPEFLFQTVSTDQFIEIASTAYGTHMPRSDWSLVKNYEVALPCLEEQIAITSILSDMDAEIDGLELKLAKVRQITQGIMQDLLTGRTRLV